MLLPACIIDDFLAPDQAGALLDFALAHENDFVPSAITSQGDHIIKTKTRRSLSFGGDLGDMIAPSLRRSRRRARG